MSSSHVAQHWVRSTSFEEDLGSRPRRRKASTNGMRSSWETLFTRMTQREPRARTTTWAMPPAWSCPLQVKFKTKSRPLAQQLHGIPRVITASDDEVSLMPACLRRAMG